MPADLYFALTLIAKMLITAGFVLAATVTAERAGPVVGGLVASLPLGAGPVYVFLALDHGARFIGASAVNSLAINAVNVIFALVYALLAQTQPLIVSQPAALVVWFVLAWAIHAVSWTVPGALLLNVVVVSAAVALSHRLRHVPIPRVQTRWTDLVLRAALVALLVGVTVTASFHIGPSGSGILAVFPIILISVQIILHRRVGGKPSAAVMANAIIGLIGFGCACIVLHFTAEPFGAAVGLMLALCAAVAWSLLVYAVRMRGIEL